MTIVIEDILKPIDPVKVCGEDLQYDPAYRELLEMLKGKTEDLIGGTPAQAPNWRDVKKQSEALLVRTLNLRVLAAYLRALVNLEGFSGLQDGLQLIQVAIKTRWESIYPQLDPEDDNDPTERLNIFNDFEDYEILLKPIQQAALFEVKGFGRFNFQDIGIAAGRIVSEKEVTEATIEAALQACDLDVLQQSYQAVTNSLDAYNQLEADLCISSKTNPNPDAKLRKLLKEIHTYLNKVLQQKGFGVEETLEGVVEGEAVNSQPKQKSGVGIINNNQDVIKILDLVCDYYRKNEPSSPVPLMVERAKRLVGKSFMEVLKDIAPGGINEAIMVSGNNNEE